LANRYFDASHDLAIAIEAAKYAGREDLQRKWAEPLAVKVNKAQGLIGSTVCSLVRPPGICVESPIDSWAETSHEFRVTIGDR
jgi:hypothetical protein